LTTKLRTIGFYARKDLDLQFDWKISSPHTLKMQAQTYSMHKYRKSNLMKR